MNARPKKFSLAYLASLLIQCHISQYTHYSNFKLASRVPRKCYPCGGIFISQNNNNLKSTIYISSPVLPGPAVYFIMCQYEERIICENGITLCFITYQPYQNQERTAVALYLYKTSQRGLVLMFLPPTDLEVRYYRKQWKGEPLLFPDIDIRYTRNLRTHDMKSAERWGLFTIGIILWPNICFNKINNI